MNITKKSDEDKKINYSDTTGILMSSVKTIVNAVSYVLIAFVSISLVVSSIIIPAKSTSKKDPVEALRSE